MGRQARPFNSRHLRGTGRVPSKGLGLDKGRTKATSNPALDKLAVDTQTRSSDRRTTSEDKAELIGHRTSFVLGGTQKRQSWGEPERGLEDRNASVEGSSLEVREPKEVTVTAGHCAERSRESRCS